VPDLGFIHRLEIGGAAQLTLPLSTMSTDLLVIVDDTYDYGWYSTELVLQWYNATSSFLIIPFTFNGRCVSMYSISLFDQILGTYAAFIGISHGPIALTIQISGSYGILNWHVSDPDPPTYKQWFTTPTLPDGKHTITFVGTSHPASVDYAVVKVGLQTSLTGQTVVVDDDSSLIQYSGQWSRSTTRFTPGSGNPISTGYPYGNVTHRSSNPGDTFTFRFSGEQLINLVKFFNRKPIQRWVFSRNIHCNIWHIFLERSRVIVHDVLDRWNATFRLFLRKHIL